MVSNYESTRMARNFFNTSINTGKYEPEGIYLSPPFTGDARVIQRWGDNADYYAKVTYHGVPLKGYMGVGFELQVGSKIIAPDSGRVVEISQDFGGLGKYIKLEHWWGESIYANLRDILVDTGQKVARQRTIATVASFGASLHGRLHFGIRVKPYDRLDGWGGFTNPLPFLYMDILRFVENRNALGQIQEDAAKPMPLLVEDITMRRP
ncbi:MAG: M23 family metallopeptidase [Caldilineaceae bacterium]